MSYVTDSLARSEELLYRARFPWFYHVGAWIGLFALVAAGVFTFANGHGQLAAGLALAGILLFIAVMLPLWTTEIAVTNQRFIYKRGLIWRTTHELQLRAIEEVNLEQGLLGRIMNYGRLDLHGTGVDDIRLPALAEPLMLRKALQDGMAAASQLGGGTAAAPIQQAHQIPHPAA